jgi:hypothetical protein
MMARRLVVISGALLFAAPLFSQSELQWFLLTETRDDVARKMGPPKMIAEFGTDFESWQYQIGEIDHDDFSHFLVFRKSDKRLISITRNYETEQNVDDLFPEKETTSHRHDGFSVRVRRLTGDRVLMALGASKPGQRVGQVMLIRQAELRHFYPWLFEQLTSHTQN